jgi:hypothetical protein
MIRTRPLLTTFSLTLIFVSSFAQSNREIIRQIKQEFKSINSDKSLEKRVLNNLQVSKESTDGGLQLTGYYKSGEIRKIILWTGLSHGNTIFEYYFRNDKLFFVYEQTNSFIYDVKKDKFRMDTTERTFEGRYYFRNNKLVDYVTTGHNRFEDDAINPESTLLKEAEENKRRLSKSRNS